MNAINNSVNTNSAAQNADSASNNFFDLHTSGVGFVNRVRETQVKKGPSTLSCGIAALRGDSKAPDKTYYDVNVVGEEAEKLIRRAMEAANDKNRQVMIRFKLGDEWLDKFIHKSGDKAGQPGASIKARLLLIEWMKVDGVLVYQRPSGSPSAGELPPGADTPASIDDASENSAPAEAFKADEIDANDETVDAHLPAVVALKKDDPEFDAKKAELKALGYRFDGKEKVWKLAVAA